MKGIAITKLVLLILGIVVLAIVIFLLYKTFVGTNPTITKQECIGKFSTACMACKMCVNYSRPCNWDITTCNIGACATDCGDGSVGSSGVCSIPPECSKYTGEIISTICPSECKKLGVD